MTKPTHVIRFIANEDGREHLGQLVDTSRDVGLDSVEGRTITAYEINGSIFNGEVTQHTLTVKHLLSPVSREDCNFIRCLGLNYKDHAKVSKIFIPAETVLIPYRKQICLCQLHQSYSASLEQLSLIHILLQSPFQNVLKTVLQTMKPNYVW